MGLKARRLGYTLQFTAKGVCGQWNLSLGCQSIFRGVRPTPIPLHFSVRNPPSNLNHPFPCSIYITRHHQCPSATKRKEKYYLRPVFPKWIAIWNRYFQCCLFSKSLFWNMFGYLFGWSSIFCRDGTSIIVHIFERTKINYGHFSVCRCIISFVVMFLQVCLSWSNFVDVEVSLFEKKFYDWEFSH